MDATQVVETSIRLLWDHFYAVAPVLELHEVRGFSHFLDERGMVKDSAVPKLVAGIRLRGVEVDGLTDQGFAA